MSNITTEQAVKHLQKVLLQDSDYRYTWLCNIAMSFKDEYRRALEKKQYQLDFHEIANKAADNFLNILTMSVDDEQP